MLTKKKSLCKGENPTSYVPFETIISVLKDKGYMGEDNRLYPQYIKQSAKTPIGGMKNKSGVLITIYTRHSIDEIKALVKEKKADGWVAVSQIKMIENDDKLRAGKEMFNLKSSLHMSRDKRSIDPITAYQIKMVYVKGICPTLVEEFNQRYKIS